MALLTFCKIEQKIFIIRVEKKTLRKYIFGYNLVGCLFPKI